MSGKPNHAAFIIAVFASRILSWRISSPMETTFVLDTGADIVGQPPDGTILILKYVSLAHTQRFKAELLAQVGSYDKAMMENIKELYKVEVIHHKTWKNCIEIEMYLPILTCMVTFFYYQILRLTIISDNSYR